MAVKPHTWISLWFLITIPVIFWDAGYCFMRPRSMEGGDLHWIWQPYGIYQKIDYIYSVNALQNGDGFPNAQSFLNIIENLLNIGYLYLAHVVAWQPAQLIGFASALMTLSKTVLYMAFDVYCSRCSTGYNTSIGDLILFFLIPNGFWIVFPSLIVFQLGKDIVASLNVAANTSTKAASRKTK